MTQFAMVEELAFLVKDNLTSKHLVLSIEEALIEFLQNDTSQDGILELLPMSPYNRLLLHRLADIFGFAHTSVGEGDDRHLILERCPESSIPPILVSDILWEYDDYQCPSTSHQLLRRKEALPDLKINPESLRSSLEEREAAYLAARERIFSVDDGEIKEAVTPKPRNVPVVARRMIAHALGQNRHSNSASKGVGLPTEQIDTGVKNESLLNRSMRPEITSVTNQKESLDKRIHGRADGSGKLNGRKLDKKPVKHRPSDGNSQQTGGPRRVVSEDSLKRETAGAAKRIFAHALGLQRSRGVDGPLMKSNELKATNKDKE